MCVNYIAVLIIQVNILHVLYKYSLQQDIFYIIICLGGNLCQILYKFYLITDAEADGGIFMPSFKSNLGLLVQSILFAMTVFVLKKLMLN